MPICRFNCVFRAFWGICGISYHLRARKRKISAFLWLVYFCQNDRFCYSEKLNFTLLLLKFFYYTCDERFLPILANFCYICNVSLN